MLSTKIPKIPKATDVQLPILDQLTILKSLKIANWFDAIKSFAEISLRLDVRLAFESIHTEVSAEHGDSEWSHKFERALAGSGLFEENCALILYVGGGSLCINEAISYLEVLLVSPKQNPGR